MKRVGFSTTPNLVLRLPMWRSRLMLFMLFVAFAALVIRALWIQGPGNAFYEAKAVKGTQRELEMSASRGKILDRNGQVIATSLEAKAVIAYNDTIPKDLSDEKIKQLAALLDMREVDVRKKLKEERNQVFLKRQVDPVIAQQIRKLEIPGIGLNNEFRRFYPEGEAMAHVVGFTNVEDHGQEGMELSRESDLAASTGKRRVVVDRLGRIVEDMGVLQLPHNGKDLKLSVDSKIQYIAYNALKDAVEKHRAKAAGAVVINVQTGEILALANWPSYNPNDRKILSGEQLRNRVMTDTFEPGSTIKPFTVALAMEKGQVNPNTVMAIGAKYLVGPKANYRHTPLSIVDGGRGYSKIEQYWYLKVSNEYASQRNVGPIYCGWIWSGPQGWISWGGCGPSASPSKMDADRSSAHCFRLRYINIPFSDGSCIHHLRSRW